MRSRDVRATTAGRSRSIYPVLRQHAAGMALRAVAFRLIEGVFYALSAVGTMILVSLSGRGLPTRAD